MLEPIKSIATATFPVEDINRAIPRPELSHYDRPTIFGILDSGFVADVSFLNRGSPMVAPMIYGRDGDRLFLHCAPASRLMRQLLTSQSVLPSRSSTALWSVDQFSSLP